jgi:phosphatidylinositol glycan class H protein
MIVPDFLGEGFWFRELCISGMCMPVPKFPTTFSNNSTTMYTSTPKLRVRSPSPTTVEFTVTTAPHNTLTRRLITYLTALLRLVLSASALLLITLKYRPASTFTLPQQGHALLHPLLAAFSISAAVPPWRYLLPISAAILYTSLFVGGYTEESLLVVRGLGVQISTTSWSGLGRRSRFIPTCRVRDLWIHEGFCGFEVRYYLAVVVEEEEELVVVFPVSIAVLPSLTLGKMALTMIGVITGQEDC